MRIRIEFDVSKYGSIGICQAIIDGNGEKMYANDLLEGYKRYRTFVEIPDMPEVTEVKAEKVEEVK